MLSSSSSAERETAWEKFLERHSRLILVTVRALTWDHDDAMDQYAFTLEGLRRDDYRRLARYAEDPRGQFEAWLVVVTRRLSIDFQRKRYGRARPPLKAVRPRDEDNAAARRRLTELMGEELNVAQTADPRGGNPEQDLLRAELEAALQAALETLDGSERLLLKLRFQDGRTAREISEAMDFPSVFHVYRALKKSLKTLRARLHERGISDPTP